MNTTVAIDLGGTNVRVARVREGKIEARLSEPVKASGTEREVLDQMCALVEKVNNGTASRIGVAVPSVVDFNTGIVYNVMNIPSWKEVHLKQYLESRFGIETHADNDVNCFVAAEKAYGAGRPFDNLVGITLGTGVGAGIVIDGKVYRGANTGAGEICSLPYLESNYEDYTSQQLFNKWHTTALAEGR